MCIYVICFCVYKCVCVSYRLHGSEKVVYVYESYIQICLSASDKCKGICVCVRLRQVRGVPSAQRSWLDDYKSRLCVCCCCPSACSPEMTTGPSLNALSSSRTNSLGLNDSPAAKMWGHEKTTERSFNMSTNIANSQ